MKGLRQYIKKHGRHFTEELAYKAAGKKWSAEDIERTAQKEVYYNVTASTLGDMIYLVHETHNRHGIKKSNCIKHTLCVIGNYNFYGGEVFREWLREVKDFDFTPYI